MIYAGIDAGSRAIKVVLLRAPNKVPFESAQGREPGLRLCSGPRACRVVERLACVSAPQGPLPQRHAEELYRSVLTQHGIQADDVRYVVATGYARSNVRFANSTITEITCHAAGVHHLLPDVRTVVEIGGQDSKILWLSPSGTVRDFAMNDRCAAGTGRFLEMVASRMERTVDEMGLLACPSAKPVAISSMCAVFAETEIIGLLASATRCEDFQNIVAGVQQAVASRIAAMAGGSVTPPLAFTGGVALLAGMDKALAAALGQAVVVPPKPQFTGALGAALLARAEGKK